MDTKIYKNVQKVNLNEHLETILMVSAWELASFLSIFRAV